MLFRGRHRQRQRSRSPIRNRGATRLSPPNEPRSRYSRDGRRRSKSRSNSPTGKSYSRSKYTSISQSTVKYATSLAAELNKHKKARERLEARTRERLEEEEAVVQSQTEHVEEVIDSPCDSKPVITLQHDSLPSEVDSPSAAASSPTGIVCTSPALVKDSDFIEEKLVTNVQDGEHENHIKTTSASIPDVEVKTHPCSPPVVIVRKSDSDIQSSILERGTVLESNKQEIKTVENLPVSPASKHSSDRYDQPHLFPSSKPSISKLPLPPVLPLEDIDSDEQIYRSVFTINSKIDTVSRDCHYNHAKMCIQGKFCSNFFLQ